MTRTDTSGSDNSGQRPYVLHTRVVTGAGGGPEKTILNSPRYLARYGIDCACLFMRPPGDAGFVNLERRASAVDAEILAVDDRGAFDWNVVSRCLEICRERRVTIWHAHDYKSNALGLLLRRYHPMHLVTTAHGWVRFTWKTPFYYWLDRLCMRGYEQVICVSKDLEASCRQSGIRANRLHQIDNAIVLEDYQTTRPGMKDKARFGFDSQRFLIGAVGRLSEEKGFDQLIRVVGRLIEEGHPVGLLIAGDGHLRPVLQKQIEDSQLSEHVRLTGFLSDPRDLYRAIDLFVLSSLREGLPNVVLEAMASRRAVVATNCNGIPDLIQDGNNGLIIPTQNPEEMYQGIRRCMLSNQLCDSLAENGRRTIEERFSFDRRMQKIVGVYRRLSPSLNERIPAQPIPVQPFEEPVECVPDVRQSAVSF